MFNLKNTKNNKFIDYLNEILAAENAAIERLFTRIQETPIIDSKKILDEHLLQEKEQQKRLTDLITDYGRRPTDSKADIISLNSLITTTSNTTKKNNNSLIENDLDGDDNNNTPLIPKEVEILNIQEDALIKNEEISAYKKILKIAEENKSKEAINILKQNLQEKETMYDNLRKSESKMLNEIEDNNNQEPFKLGFSVADMLTSYWNSKENPPKTYLFNRRLHHGTIGALLGLSSLYKKNPMITGILSGLGAGLQKDDYKDSKEWFLFKKKEDETNQN
jgi:ferritin-like metal-binding protein YciE